jgi:hypothetical protein
VKAQGEVGLTEHLLLRGLPFLGGLLRAEAAHRIQIPQLAFVARSLHHPIVVQLFNGLTQFSKVSALLSLLYKNNLYHVTETFEKSL